MAMENHGKAAGFREAPSVCSKNANELTRLQATQSLSKLYESLATFWSAAGETPYHGARKDSANAVSHRWCSFQQV